MRLTRTALVAAIALLPGAPGLLASGFPVISGRPRLLVVLQDVPALKTKAAQAGPGWVALKGLADQLVSYAIFPYDYANRTAEPAGAIFYDYQGEGWFRAAMSLGIAYLATNNTAYANKLAALADEMIRAQSAPGNNPPNGLPPLQVDNYYPTRYLGPAIAAIYDWCYSSLGSTRRSQMVALMNAWFDDLKSNAYQRNDHPDGNYFWGHAAAAAWMGYASFGDNPRAQEMIDWARIRFDGTSSPLVTGDEIPQATIVQAFEGGVPPAVATDGGPPVTGAPWGGGLTVQGWAYTTGTWCRLIDTMLVVFTATGENLFAAHPGWLSAILRSEKHALAPNFFEIDPVGDWGGDYGAVVLHSLPLRLSAFLAGTSDGPGAQHFYASELADVSPYGDADFPDAIYRSVYKPAEWEQFFYDDPSRPSAVLQLPLFFGPFAAGVAGAQPYFVMRSGASSSSVWASAHMGAAWWDDHQHYDAGSVLLRRANDWLIVDASSWKGGANGHGLVGSSTEADNAASANTLFFHDWGDFQRTGEQQYLGGQGAWGLDVVAAAEQNDAYTYVRSDLSTAYDNGGDPAAQAGRRLDFFYRSFLYLRSAGVFAVFDQVRVEPSSNPHGPYLAHLRWHFPARPSLSGNRAQVVHGISRLDLDTVLPAGAALAVVNEAANPDGSLIPCVNPCNSGTYRLEVSGTAGMLSPVFLTVFEAVASGASSMATRAVASVEGALSGVEVQTPSGKEVVYFNSGTGALPAPITSATLPLPATPPGAYTICGVVPGAHYWAGIEDGAFRVVLNASGPLAASSAGILRFSPTLPAPRSVSSIPRSRSTGGLGPR
jgi:hypothetical protein